MQSDRFKQARKGKSRESLSPDMQTAIAHADTTAMLAYIESRVNTMNIPPAQKQAFNEIFKLILLAGE